MTETVNPKRNRTLFEEIAAIFTSVKTTLTILFLLAAVSIVGTVIPQTQTPEPGTSLFYYRLAAILDLHNIYRSWWFLLILTALGLNLLGCLMQRLPKIPVEWRGTAKKALVSHNIVVNKPAKELVPLFSSVGTNLLGAKPSISATDKLKTLSWVKHRIFLLGFPLLHSAIIIILLGASIGLFYGTRGHVLIKEGESASQYILSTGKIQELPFDIVVDQFTLKKYATGEPQEFRSDVRLVENGKEVKKAAIRVNHPVTLHGLSLYQSDYKLVGIKNVTVTYKQGDAPEKELIIVPRKIIPIPNTSLQLQLQNIDPGGGTRAPSIQLMVIKPEPNQSEMLFLYRSQGARMLGDIAFSFTDYLPLYATGLQITSDPGTPLVWTGCILLIIGFALLLFTNYRRLYIEIKDQNGKSNIIIKGSSHRLRSEYRKNIDQQIVTLVALDKAKIS